MALILALIFGGHFASEHEAEVTVSEVSILSEADFAVLIPPGAAPDISTDAPDVSAPREDTVPDTPNQDIAPARSEPEMVEVPDTPENPDITVPEPLPDAIVDDQSPVLPLAPSEFDGTSLERDAIAAPAPRVSETPQIAPPPDVETAPEIIEDQAPEPVPEVKPEPEPEAPAAPEEASDRIVTEAEEVETFAPASSKRPRSRPARPVRTAETPEPARDVPDTDATAEAIAAAVAEAASEEPAPRGPPLSGGEKEAFKLAVGGCWNVDSGGRSAGVKVTVRFSLDRQGKVVGDVEQIRVEGGELAAQRVAFAKARRAVLRCQRGGYQLPVEKYEQWKVIEATFNPEGMQFR